jgi:ketosteroid isomerase-like protein
MRLTKQQEKEAMKVYETYWDNYLMGDVESMAGLLDDDYTQVGSAETEVFSNKKDAVKFLHDTIDQVTRKLEMRNRNTRLDQQGELVLVHELCDIYVLTDDKWVFYSKFRATTIMEDKKDGWKIIHQHSSFPDARTGEGENVAIDKIAEENRELREAVKRRTVELEQKSRELEIEASLEKVRSVAMGMRKPDDMLDVCRIISDQLQSLGVNNIRNVQTAIIHEQESTYLNYQYFAAYNKCVIEEAEYNKHPKAREMAETMKRSANAFFSQSFDGEELNVFRQYRKQDNQLPDPILEESNSIHFYFYSIGPGALGISTYNSTLSESDTSLFKRFRNVFELAYSRFTDIELAIAQAREAKIEASLERVRAAAMSMNKPDDLLNVCEVLFTEFHKLGFDEMRNAMINIHNDEKGTFINYDYSDEIGRSINHLTYNIHPIIEKQIKQIRSANDAFSETSFTGKDLDEWKKFRNKIGEKDDPRIYNISALYYYFYSIGTGSIGISTFSPIGEEKHTLLKRFRNVFSLSYQRYSDLALAEAQAREAQIELALERVRARTMAMQNSNELVDTSTVLFHQLKILGIGSIRTGVATMDEANETVEVWSTSGISGNFEKKILGVVPVNVHPMFTGIFNSWKNKEPYYAYELKSEDLKKYYKTLSSYLSYPEQTVFNEREIIYTFFFPEGSLNVVSHIELSEEDRNIVIRFAKVFGLVYTRFLDLKKAEAQAREAKIETALEKVRSRTMGMQKSEELKDVIQVVYEQFVHLKINVDHAGFVVDYTPKGDWHFWIADEQDIPSKITHPYFDSVWAHQFNDAKEKGIDFFATNLNFEEKNKFYNELLSYVPGLPEASKDFYLSCPGLAASTVLLEDVGLYIENFSGIPYTDDENNTLMRFGKVFQQTYTRFLDLQKAEAQAREGQIQLALERVRARTMAMQHSDELQDAAKLLFQQIKLMGIETGSCGFNIWNKDEKTATVWVSSPEGGLQEPFSMPHTVSNLYREVHQAKEDEQNYFVKELRGKVLQNHFDYLLTLAGIGAIIKRLRETGYNFPEKIIFHFAFFAQGYLSFHLHNTNSEAAEIFQRFAIVFEQTYTRFLDLQKAEAQAREAKIEAALEKVRTVALSLKKSDEMLDIAQVLYEQLLELGFTNIRNSIIDIHNDNNETFLDYDYSHDMGRTVTLMSYYDDPIIEKQVRQIESSSDAFFEIILEGQDLQDLIDIRLKNGESEDPRLRQIEQLTYNLYSFGNGAIGISNFGLPSDEQKIVLKRFRNVFAFAYKRYTDMVRAETQAREAQIEASLERVRSRAMSMHSPNDLSETVNVFFKELKTLGIIPIRCGVGQIDESTRTTSLTTTTSSQQGESFRVIGKVKQTGHPVLDGIFDHWKLQKEYHPILEGEDIKAYYKVMNAQIDYPEYSGEVTQYGNNFFFKEGFVFAWTENLLSEEELIIFRRFTSVLSLTYRRYLDLKEAEERNKIIQADNDRKTKELEEARQLQLSLLPRTLPQLSQFDIAVYMKTATEVGGDYYDFNVQPNGVLNIGIGDATGHGLQAGTMITLMKGFFTADVAKFSPQKFLEHCNGIIRDIKLGRILMSFSHLRIENNCLLISSAGMPPVYYHHKKNNRTEEIIIQGLPLGAMGSTSYKLVEKQLNSGDTILLLTDGLPEQMNNHKVIFDYSRVLKYFDEIAEYDPKEIINRLVQKADDWMDGQKQSDDVTFVVIKVK